MSLKDEEARRALAKLARLEQQHDSLCSAARARVDKILHLRDVAYEYRRNLASLMHDRHQAPQLEKWAAEVECEIAQLQAAQQMAGEAKNDLGNLVLRCREFLKAQGVEVPA